MMLERRIASANGPTDSLTVGDMRVVDPLIPGVVISLIVQVFAVV